MKMIKEGNDGLEDHEKAKGGGEGHRKDILLRIGQ